MHSGLSHVPHTQPATGSAEPSHSGPKSILHLLRHIMRSHVDKRAIRLTFSRWWRDVVEETRAAKTMKQLWENRSDEGIAVDWSQESAQFWNLVCFHEPKLWQEFWVMKEFLHCALCIFGHTELPHNISMVLSDGVVCIKELGHLGIYLFQSEMLLLLL